MWELAGQLVPEMVGLSVTPAAIVACLLLLGSSRPFRNVAMLAAPFLVIYGAISVAAFAVGQSADLGGDDPTTRRGWLSLVVGFVFLAVGLWSWLRPPRPHGAHSSAAGATPDAVAEPGWVPRLRDPSLRLVLAAGAVLAVVNPNVAILASGLGIVITADATLGVQAGGVALLLAASLVDFVVPTLVFVLAGEPGRRWLRSATRWLLGHNHAIGIGVLLVFGLLFVGRGLAQIVG